MWKEQRRKYYNYNCGQDKSLAGNRGIGDFGMLEAVACRAVERRNVEHDSVARGKCSSRVSGAHRSSGASLAGSPHSRSSISSSCSFSSRATSRDLIKTHYASLEFHARRGYTLRTRMKLKAASASASASASKAPYCCEHETSPADSRRLTHSLGFATHSPRPPADSRVRLGERNGALAAQRGAND